MNEIVIWVGILIGIALIAGLCWFIKTKMNALNVIKEKQLQQEKQKAEKRDYLLESIKVITTAMLEEQVELSEGCIRIKVLIDHLDASLHEQESFKIFEKMYRETEHMPTHEARKQTDKNFIHKLDQQRYALEKKYRDEIHQAAKLLLNTLAWAL